jgi:hypothetical protein
VDPTTSSGLRVVRGALTAPTVLGLAVGAHTLGGGDLPPVLSLAALGSIVLLATVVLSQWRPRLWYLVPVLGVGQLALHHALALLSGGRPLAHGSSLGMHASMTPETVGSSAAPVLDGMATAMSPVMLMAHAAATVATALVLVGGDRAARMALHWWASVPPLHGLHRTPAPTSARPVPMLVPDIDRPCARMHRADPRRGPPWMPSAA